MITYINGNLFNSNAEALVNAVNTVGVMGKGIALQFKDRFPNNYKKYVKACKDKSFTIGQLLVVNEATLLNGLKTIINFPTKTHWKLPSEYRYIELGLHELARVLKERNIRSVAIPALGVGNGGLDWDIVKQSMELYLSDIECDVRLYLPCPAAI